ncbi:iron reductase [Mycena galericulata]|nr:iron reductase [Mycena galericulata]
MSTAGEPVIPANLLPYESYTEDPIWQTHFTIMWCAAMGLILLLAAPRALSLRGIRESMSGWLGVRVGGEYEALPQEGSSISGPVPIQRRNAFTTAARVIGSVRLWSLPGISLNFGQIFIVAGYITFALVCIVMDVPLMTSPNRAGFLALAQLPPVFLFATKNSPLTSLLLGPGVDYTKLNFIHRWSARGLFLGAVVHGSLWINNHLVYDLPILTQQKECSGVAALGVLCIIVLSSLASLRRWCYSAFLLIHYLAFPAFFVTICYHTLYAVPWIFPPLAFYGADLLLRILRWRVVVGRAEARDGGMTLVHIPEAAKGWRGGQHVQMRVLIGGRAWEGHPLSICSAAPDVTCLSDSDKAPLGMLLAARACGDWSRALYAFASTPQYDGADDIEPAAPTSENIKRAPTAEDESLPGREAHLVLEGPYGGPTLRASDFETVLLFAGGSGASFTLGVLDDLVGRCVRLGRAGGEKTHRIEWCWCVRSFGAIRWFAPYLLQIATAAARPDAHLDLTIRIFVTCLCDPDAVPAIPGCTVTEARPSVSGVLGELLSPPCSDDSTTSSSKSSVDGLPQANIREVDLDVEKGVRKGAGAGYTQGGGGIAVFAAGPGSLLREAGNAVAGANMSARGLAAGAVEFCTEAFKM